jgi:very-short-patch-repair endonuclease
MAKNCIESPIEQLLFIAISMICKLRSIEFICDALNENPSQNTINLMPQYPIGKYRIDFKVIHISRDGVRTELFVECDGHAFHDRTADERAYEKTRDNFIQSQNFKVFHFTGKQIVNDPLFVAVEIISHVIGRKKEELMISYREGDYWKEKYVKG